MVTIREGKEPYTLVNVFQVEPENQEALASLLRQATDSAMRQLPGFISANIHRSYDGRRVVNYAQWRSREDYEAMQRDPKATPHMAEAAQLTESFDPILCEVVESFEVSG